MGSYMFGCGRGLVSFADVTRIGRIARPFGAWFVSVQRCAEGPRYWFEAPNRGEPFDGATARAVLAEVHAAGLLNGGAK